MVRRNGGRPMHGSLRRRLDSCKSTFSTVDEIVSHLRSTYPDYHRVKHQTLTRLVQRLLMPRANHAPKRIDEGEGRLKKRQALHMHGEEEDSECSASTSFSSGSTSEDAIFRENYETGVDLMKTMLREAYTPRKDDSVRRKMKPVVEDKIVESELVKDEEKAGPRFSDFGGMKDILDKLLYKGPELLDKFVGESERKVRLLFSRARACSPCIIFFDEVDGLSTKRDMEGGSSVERLVTQFLAELDGAQKGQGGVYVIGATNRPDKMDAAFLRPGRFGKKVYIPLPSFEQRFSILKVLARKMPVDPTVDLRAIAKTCENFSGADLAELVDEAAEAVINEKFMYLDKTLRSIILPRHFDIALSKVSNSVSPEERRSYEQLADNFKSSRGS
ncbi:hypothetical protein PIB30_047563 [Stylosanthes scabra]|uniref:Uncharacterized protein n=1 Tax=Stylosanthes scabra TaxID=79078 RepID=A0ABU6VJ11_9FABA|nr:hypothetical protein [Stylosanthes scabra]